MARIRCESCDSVMDESTVEDIHADQCPDCGEFTGFELVEDTCSECGGPLGELELSDGYDICFGCLTGEWGE